MKRYGYVKTCDLSNTAFPLLTLKNIDIDFHASFGLWSNYA